MGRFCIRIEKECNNIDPSNVLSGTSVQHVMMATPSQFFKSLSLRACRCTQVIRLLNLFLKPFQEGNNFRPKERNPIFCFKKSCLCQKVDGGRVRSLVVPTKESPPFHCRTQRNVNVDFLNEDVCASSRQQVDNAKN